VYELNSSNGTSLASDKKEIINEHHSNDGKLSILSKICFGIGGLPHQLITNTIALYITPFLLEIAEVMSLNLIDILIIIYLI
jgi:hypothetical protein